MLKIIDKRIIEGFKIQLKVVKALILREMITRWDRKNIGFLWLVFEPFIFITVITVAIAVFRYYTRITMYRLFGVDILAFILTGYCIAFLWRRPPQIIGSAIRSNIGLLAHRNIKVFDLFAARYIVEMTGVTTSFLILMLFFVTSGLIAPPSSIARMIAAWLLMMWFTFGLCFVVGSILAIKPKALPVWIGFSLLIYFVSGSLFLVDWLPPKLQSIVLLNPIVHGTEMIRHGYYGDSIKTFENPTYLIGWNLVLMSLGLNMIRMQKIINSND